MLRSSFAFPTDLLIEILKRLPLQSLIRSSIVCKSWQSLLTSPIFMSAHISHNSLTNSINVGFKKTHLFKPSINAQTNAEGFQSSKFLLYNEKLLIERYEIECPVGKSHFVVSSCDGLICLFDFYSKVPNLAPLVLWNPSIQRTHAIPAPPDGTLEITPWGFPKLIFGCGYDCLSSEYKVLRVNYFDCGLRGTGFVANVYDLSVGKWRSLDMSFVPHSFLTIRWRGVCLNGVIHWVSNINVSSLDEGDDSLVHRSILTFKLSSEVFGTIDFPKAVSNACERSTRVLTVPKGSKEVLGVIHNVDKLLSLWVMEDYGAKESWVKLFSFNTIKMPENDMNVVVLSEKCVAVKTWSGCWISYDVTSERTDAVWPVSDRYVYVDSFVDSLILLTQGNGTSSAKGKTRGSLKKKGPGLRRSCRIIKPKRRD